MSDIKVSVIVPIYNVEEYLPRCIDSLINQTLDSYEIILVNDNSKDNTKQLIEKLVAADSRIVGINFSKNFGQPSGLLAGFRMAKGNTL